MELSGRGLNIAVVGSGIAGLSAAWLLGKRHKVTLYEKNDRPGGHSNTIELRLPHGKVAVDTGFIVYNTRTYPNLTALFDHLGVRTDESDMSFAASLRGGAMEYSGTDINGLLGQRRNLFRPRFWRMLTDIKRFYAAAPAFLDAPDSRQPSLGEYLAQEGYGEAFVRDHLLPMGAAIWSTTPSDMLAYPARAFLAFFRSHGLLQLHDRPQWRTVAGGSREYVARLTATLPNAIRYGGVRAVRRIANGVEIVDRDGSAERFDHVVLATHADEALGLLADADGMERDLLGPWRYTKNVAVLHGDTRLMPRRKRVWSSWNFIDGAESPDTAELCVTYWMNRLQRLDGAPPLFVTLNPAIAPDPAKIHRMIDYTHPYFDAAASRTQSQLWSLQGRRRTWFCGSYFGHGFHEDALQAGLAVAEELGGVRRPWNVPDESGRIQLIGEGRAAA